jgi:hypothetical protein
MLLFNSPRERVSVLTPRENLLTALEGEEPY